MSTRRRPGSRGHRDRKQITAAQVARRDRRIGLGQSGLTGQAADAAHLAGVPTVRLDQRRVPYPGRIGARRKGYGR